MSLLAHIDYIARIPFCGMTADVWKGTLNERQDGKHFILKNSVLIIRYDVLECRDQLYMLAKKSYQVDDGPKSFCGMVVDVHRKGR